MRILPRQEVAFGKKVRKIKGCGSLREDFYTRFKQKKCGFGLWHGLLKGGLKKRTVMRLVIFQERIVIEFRQIDITLQENIMVYETY